MNTILHCGGMPFNGTTIEHQSLGGSETSAYYLAKQLVSLGHKVTVFTSCSEDEQGNFDGVDYVSHGEVTKETPLGMKFHAYAENTPCDVMIIQRHPQAFQFKWASKVNVWWAHDLALKRAKNEVTKQMWNVDIVWAVSEYHKQQIIDTWGFAPRIIHPVKNGVDAQLVELAKYSELPESVKGITPITGNKKVLLYSSRPERGLEHLVAPSGIMEQLGGDYHLLVCAYENVTPQMDKYYTYLNDRCEELPNVTNIGSLTKAELYKVMQTVDLHVYPTEFEEVSCITAMEAMACGLPMVTSRHGALPETCRASGVRLLKLKDGRVDIAHFVSIVKESVKHNATKMLQKNQFGIAGNYYWHNVVNSYVDSIMSAFSDKSEESIVKHFVEHSDISALKKFAETRELSPYSEWLVKKTLPLYEFANDPKTQEEHYEDYYADSTLTKQGMENSPRYDYISSLLNSYPAGSTVLDYGCGHGHFTNNLAKRYPDLFFVGVDLSAKNIKFARDWAKEEGLTNATFYQADVMQGFDSDFWYEQLETLDCVLCAEVLEHVVDYIQLAARLTSLLKAGGKFIATTPYGRWEWQSFREYGDSRFHLHHFERQDIVDMIGDNADDFIINIPAGNDNNGFLLGSYVWGFTKTHDWVIGTIDYERKLTYLKPRQLCSLNMIAKDCEDTVVKAISSCADFVDEVVVGVDDTTTDSTASLLYYHQVKLADENVRLEVIKITSPLKTGFSEARNKVLTTSSLDWILWIDSDEVAQIAGNARRLLKHNEFNGYAVRQHHFSMDPAGILKTDLPLRLFRNNIGIKFHGLVHEHPERHLNDGAGHAQLIDAISIGHYGYDTEETRRGRFERNIDLMIRDRDESPDRKLGKMLWVRDLAMMNQYELEHNGMRVTDGMVVRCREGLKVWRELVEEGETRLILDSMQFYNQLLEVMGYEFEACISIGMSKVKGSTDASVLPVVSGLFAERKDFENLTNLLLEENYDDFDSRYY